MDASYRHIADLLGQVRSRWRRLLFQRAALMAALAVAAVLAAGLAFGYGAGRSSHALAAVGVVTIVLAVAVAIRAFAPVRHAPSDRQLARFIEERDPTLDDRLVSAVDVASARGDHPDEPAPAFAAAMVADAGRRASAVEPGSIIASDVLRRGALRAVAALALVAAVAFTGRHAARRSFDALSLSFFPARVQLSVAPGDARVQAGSSVTIEARLVGNTAPVAAQLQRADGEGWLSTDMPPDADGTFRMRFDALGESFRYRVIAGTLESDVHDIEVVRPPRVTRVDVEYRYPAALGLEARTEEDTGDIYAPAGTDVRLVIHTDRDAAAGHMALGGGQTVQLTAATPTRLEASMRIDRDDSYRLRVADRDGMSAPGETEYFIRVLDDRPPDVRVLKPARDRRVTALDEVDIQAEAQDDFGVAALELVYTVRGTAERVVPFDVPKRTPVVTGDLTLFLEDLKVQPGDFISYYVRARDLPRGRRSSEARSDMFFLEVIPFEQEFTLARSQGGGAGGGSPQIDDLVNAQKEVIVATWKLDRRALASGASSEADIRTVAKAEAELKARVEATASQFRDSTMRDPRRRSTTPGAPRAGQALPEEDAMTAASKAMSVAVTALEKLQTKTAMPPELEALNHLLRAQAEVRQREITRQTGTGGAGQNRQTQDLSSLFDKELARQQQTNYETPNNAEQKPETEEENLLDKIRELAKRQDELLRRQEELAKQRQQLSAEQMKRALETLTREQERLREQAEQVARELSRGQPSGTPREDGSGQRSSADPQRQSGDQAQSGQQQRSGGQQQGQGSQQAGSATGQSGQAGQSGQSRPGEQDGRTGDRGSRMREVSEEMRSAASELSRQDPTQASARANRALDKLRDLERQMQAGRPDEQRRAIGDLQLEARQLADAQRQLSSEFGRVGQGENGRDALRRIAGEEERLADRAERLQQNIERQANAPGSEQAGRSGNRAGASGAEQSANAQRALGEAARDMQRQRLSERMQQSADQMRGATGAATPRGNGAQRPSGTPQGSSDTPSSQQAARAVASGQDEIARAFDRLADRLAAATGPSDDQSRKMTDQLARAQDLREEMARLSRELEKLGDQSGPQGAQPGGQNAAGRAQDGKPSPSNEESADARGGGQSGQGQAAGVGSGGEAERLRDEYARRLKAAKELLDELQRDDRTSGRGGSGFTFEGQGMVLSAPGTQAFKQDFAKWEELRRQATQLLEQAESTLSKRLQAKSAKERLASGLDDQPPASYSQQVESYFKALAAKKGR